MTLRPIGLPSSIESLGGDGVSGQCPTSAPCLGCRCLHVSGDNFHFCADAGANPLNTAMITATLLRCDLLLQPVLFRIPIRSDAS